jgi:CRISPR-associated protein Cas1
MTDFHEIPKFEDRWSYLYLERGRLDCDASSLLFVTVAGESQIPIDQTAALFLGPGTRVSAAAMKLLARNNCLLCWTGEDGHPLYAHSTGGTHSSHRLLRQAELYANPKTRLAVVRRMLRKRFEEPFPDNLTLQQMRGVEGNRVEAAYRRISEKTGVRWDGRRYDQGDWSRADPVNRALSAANAFLYGLCHAAILSAGYSAAIGFIHSGKMLSFVYDVADFYKTEVVIPLAFDVARESGKDVEKRIRLACRRAFFSANLVERILPDIAEVLNAPDDLKECPNELEGRAVSLADRTDGRNLRGQPE